MSVAKNYITPVGAAKLKSELKELLHHARPEVVRTVAWAASNGDRSENGDYIYGKRRLREIDRRIRFLQQRLERAEVIDPLAQARDRVLFGATVTVEDDAGKERTYRIVGEDEFDAKTGAISWRSPVAKALLGAREGDTVKPVTPGKGRDGEEWTILKIEYLAGEANKP